MSNIITEIRDHVLTVTINRAERKNAITLDMYTMMAKALESAENDKEVRVILFKGTQGVFTAGNDLEDFLTSSPRPELPADQKEATDLLSVQRFIHALVHSTVPMIAAVEGFAVGIGVTMLLHCDLVIAADNAVFSLPFTNLGLVPEAGSTYLLPHIMGRARASELMLSGRSFTAAEALSYGLVSEVCTPEQLAELSIQKTLAYAAKPPASMRETKALMKNDMSVVLDHIQKESAQFSKALASPEAKEAMMAFMEKRKPNFDNF